MNYLLDTNVLIAALRSRRGASHALIRLVLQGKLPVVMHHKLLAEYRDVLSRPDIIDGLSFSWEEIEQIVAGMVVEAHEVKINYLWRPNLKDEGDNFVLEIAVAASPCTLVTHNLRDFRAGELQFHEVWVKTPQQVLAELAPH
jgi:putative PIN family toxin of toxin-antitoxin system